VLLFTAPSKNWDWCLYETGLYTRFERAEKNQVSSVVCLFSPGQASPSPIADLQGVPVVADKVRAFLDQFCRKTWSISDDWRHGATGADVKAKQVEDAARAIERAFRRSGSTSTHFPAIAWCCPCPSRQDRKRDPRERAGGGRAKRHLGLHAVVVQPGQRNRQAIMGRSPSSG